MKPYVKPCPRCGWVSMDLKGTDNAWVAAWSCRACELGLETSPGGLRCWRGPGWQPTWVPETTLLVLGEREGGD